MESLTEELVRITPYVVDPPTKLLSLLKVPANYLETIVNPTAITVPIYKSVNVTSLINKNAHKLQVPTTMGSSGDAQDADQNLDAEMIEEAPKLLVEISRILPRTLADQLTTVLIRGFPNLKAYAAELILDVFLGQNNKHNLYTWSFVNHDFVEHSILVVKFSTLSLVKWFLHTYQASISAVLGVDNCIILANPELANHLEEIESAEIDVDTAHVTACVKRIIEAPANRDDVAKHSGTEDLDKVMNYYKNYKVDPVELIDVPSDMKNKIVTEIITFRSKVLENERKKRKQEIEDERIKTKQRLKHIFEQVQEAQDDTITQSQDMKEARDKEEEEEDDNAVYTDPEIEDLDENEYQEYLEMEKHESLEKDFTNRLGALAKREETERNPLMVQLDKIKNYEDDLWEHKLEHINTVKKQAALISSLPYTSHDGLSSWLLNLYNTDHPRYVSERKRIRLAEEVADAEDKQREEEVKQKEKEKETMQENVMAIAPDNSSSKGIEPLAQVQGDAAIAISKLKPHQVTALQEKIASLVAEYLGIRDDFLIQVINDNLGQPNLEASRAALVADLTEVLDDDADNLVNDLWKYIDSLIVKNI